MSLTIAIDLDADGWKANVAELPGVRAVGPTRAEAVAKAKAAALRVLADRAERGEELPEGVTFAETGRVVNEELCRMMGIDPAAVDPDAPPLPWSLLTAPFDDETETLEEAAAAAAGRADIAAGRVYSHEEVCRELGIDLGMGTDPG